MKTIQQTLKELNTEEVIDYYFSRYPIKLFGDLNEKWDDKTVAECRKHGHDTVKGLIDKILSMEAKQNEKNHILFCSKCIQDRSCHDIEDYLVDMDELMNAKTVSEISTYAYEYEKLEDTVGYFVADTAFTQNNLMDLVTSYLFESSFFGYKQENLEKERQLLNDAIEECEDTSKMRSFSTLEELYEDLGITPEEAYPEEEEKRSKYHDAVVEYNKYCMEMELERLKESILEGKRG